MGKCRKVFCLTNSTWYNSMKECAKALNISHSSINDSIRDGKPHMGYQFSYDESTSVYEECNPVDAMLSDTSMIWKDVQGYEGLYKVSDKGDVISLGRTLVRMNGKIQSFPAKLLKQSIIEGKYSMVSLTDSQGVLKSHLVHRLVAEAFIPNIENKPEVNHIDGTMRPLNNSVTNLEWATSSENNSHANRTGLRDSKKCADMCKAVWGRKAICIETSEKFECFADIDRFTHKSLGNASSKFKHSDVIRQGNYTFRKVM